MLVTVKSPALRYPAVESACYGIFSPSFIVVRHLNWQPCMLLLRFRCWYFCGWWSSSLCYLYNQFWVSISYLGFQFLIADMLHLLLQLVQISREDSESFSDYLDVNCLQLLQVGFQSPIWVSFSLAYMLHLLVQHVQMSRVKSQNYFQIIGKWQTAFASWVWPEHLECF